MIFFKRKKESPNLMEAWRRLDAVMESLPNQAMRRAVLRYMNDQYGEKPEPKLKAEYKIAAPVVKSESTVKSKRKSFKYNRQKELHPIQQQLYQLSREYDLNSMGYRAIGKMINPKQNEGATHYHLKVLVKKKYLPESVITRKTGRQNKYPDKPRERTLEIISPTS